MGTIDELVRDLRRFENRKEVTAQLRKELRAPVPAVRKSIRARALSTLPASGGLNRWAASTRVTASVRVTGRDVAVRVKGGRNSRGGRSDIRALDRGRIRHPSWGRRGAGQWHTQQVTPGFFSNPTAETDQWRQAALRAVDNALEVIRRG